MCESHRSHDHPKGNIASRKGLQPARHLRCFPIKTVAESKLEKENGRKSHAASKRYDPVKGQATEQDKARSNARPKRRQPKEQEY